MCIENGWVLDERHNMPHKVGTCDCCGRMIYEDEDYDLNGERLLCFDCVELLKDEEEW